MTTKSSKRRPGIATIMLVGGIAAALLLMIWAIVGRQIVFEEREALRMAAEQNDDRALMLQQFVSRTLDNAALATLRYSDASIAHSAPREVAQKLGSVTADGAFPDLARYDAAGRLIAATSNAAWRGGDAQSALASMSEKESGANRTTVSKPFYSPERRGPVIWLVRRIDDVRGRFAGIAVAAMDPAQLTEIFGQAAVKPSESAWVVGLDGIIRSRASASSTASGEDVSNGALFRLQRGAERGRYMGLGTLDHRMRLVSHRRIPDYPLFASYSILEEEVLRETRQRARVFAIGGFLLSLATILLAWMLVREMHGRETRAAEMAAARRRLEDAQRIARVGDWTYALNENGAAWSPYLYEMYERDPALGPMYADFIDLLSEDSVKVNREARLRLVKEGLPATWELEVRLPSGRDRVHFVSAVPTRDPAGTIIGFHGTTQDITETRRHEALQRELAHFARVGAMNSLAATLSHELTQPLAAASNYLSTGRILADRLPDNAGAPIAARLVEAAEQVKRAGEIIKRMRSLVTRGSGESTNCLVEEVLDEALATVGALKMGAVEFVSTLPDEEVLVLCDSVQIQQVVLNLVRNACEAQAGFSEAPARLTASLDGDMVIIAVRDHGPGFPDTVLRKLCQPFLTSKEGGLGLGLSISRTIAEAHGGTLRAENCASGGAIVSLLLPRRVA